MFNLKTEIEKVSQRQTALGHFNVSNFEMLKAVCLAGQELSQVRGGLIPLIIGLSESERQFLGSRQMVAFIKSWQEETHYPIFTNADHCHSLESVQKACEDGFDSIVVDYSRLLLAENIQATKEAVFYVRENYPSVLVEGELGVLGEHSTILSEIPEEVKVAMRNLTTVEEAKEFTQATGVDCLAPAVGNLHGMLEETFNPDLNIDRIKEIAIAIKQPLVLHGGSGLRAEEIKKAILAGMSVVHISTELRKAYRSGVQSLGQDFFAMRPKEVVPYKIMQLVIDKMKELVKQKLELFG